MADQPDVTSAVEGHPVEAIREAVDRIVAESRDLIGITGKLYSSIYEASDGQCVLAVISAYEMYLVDRELAGEEIAQENHKAMRSDGNGLQ